MSRGTRGQRKGCRRRGRRRRRAVPLAPRERRGWPADVFPEEDLVERHVGVGEYRGLEFLHVNAKRVINPVPEGFENDLQVLEINSYRG